MSEIKNIIKDEKSILAFDVDGVLAALEFGLYNHYSLNDEEFNKKNEEGINYYTEDLVIKRMQKFLNSKNNERLYIISTIGSENEGKFKKEYILKYYNIKEENIFFVKNDNKKLDLLNKIKEINNISNLKNIVMIDDSINVLNYIMDNSDYSTVHISSFLDL